MFGREEVVLAVIDNSEKLEAALNAQKHAGVREYILLHRDGNAPTAQGHAVDIRSFPGA
jgi:hypothetical protein